MLRGGGAAKNQGMFRYQIITKKHSLSSKKDQARDLTR